MANIPAIYPPVNFGPLFGVQAIFYGIAKDCHINNMPGSLASDLWGIYK